MQFRILGPLEVSFHDQVLPLGGFKQRAALGLLLLRANRVVATSEMLTGLWPEEELPATARKIVQNAIWSLRALLSPLPGDEDPPGSRRPELLTQAPGYLLRVDSGSLDVNRFERQVAEGRARLAAGDAEEAARLLREALAEWRGPALADLAEHDVAWPELTVLGQLRLDVMEDRFEAELRCGRHQAVLGELVSLVAEQPLRERLCRQLMLALYRCGRQAEALSAFTRVRRALVEEYGLEPSRELQLLQQSILTHDPALAAPAVTGGEPVVLAEVRPLQGAPRTGNTAPEARGLHVASPRASAAAHGADRAQDRPAPRPADPVDPAGSGSPTPPAAGQDVRRRTADGPVTERRQVSAVLVRTGFTAETDALGDDRTAPALHAAGNAFADGVEEFGGTVVGSLGYVSVAVFGLRGEPRAASLDAVAAAFAVRDRFADIPGPTFHAAVIAGSALVRHDPHDPTVPVTVAGRLLDDALTLLGAVPPGEVHISGDAARIPEPRNRHSTARSGRPPQATGHERPLSPLPPLPPLSSWAAAPGTVTGPPKEPVGHEHELSITIDLLDHSRRTAAPYLMTILGEEGVGKTRFLEDFEQQVTDVSPEVRVIRVGGAASGGNSPRLARDILAACCGLPPGAGVDGRFTEAVRRLAGSGAAERLLYHLIPLMGPAGRCTSHDEVHASWIEVVALAARERPIVLCFDDVHRSEDPFLDCVERLVATARPAPLFVMAAARPELLERRPFWGSGQRHAGTLTLERWTTPREDFVTRFTDQQHTPENFVPPASFPRHGARGIRRPSDHGPFVARHADR
ncbi:BTAD domain-containing putative transcriptional regulator [Streptomyces griseoviridis]